VSIAIVNKAFCSGKSELNIRVKQKAEAGNYYILEKEWPLSCAMCMARHCMHSGRSIAKTTQYWS